MRIAFITRSTLFTVHGGDTVQVEETAKQLRLLGVEVTIHLTGENISYEKFDLLHFFNLTRPADIVYHIKKSGKPFAISPILVEHYEYDKRFRKGISGWLLRNLSPASGDYLKTLSRWILGKDKLRTKSYLWIGQTKSIKFVLKKAALLLPNSESEYSAIQKSFGLVNRYKVVPNGVDLSLFNPAGPEIREKNLVLCAGRIEGRKNQLNLIRALRNTEFKLILAGKPAPNQLSYFEDCKREATSDVEFADMLEQDQLARLYRRANVHVLPSWFESCGLSSLEAAAMGCNIVITDKGFTRDYFEEDAFYCDPADPASILKAIQEASKAGPPLRLQKRIKEKFTWSNAASITLEAYKEILRG